MRHTEKRGGTWATTVHRAACSLTRARPWRPDGLFPAPPFQGERGSAAPRAARAACPRGPLSARRCHRDPLGMGLPGAGPHSLTKGCRHCALPTALQPKGDTVDMKGVLWKAISRGRLILDSSLGRRGAQSRRAWDVFSERLTGALSQPCHCSWHLGLPPWRWQ